MPLGFFHGISTDDDETKAIKGLFLRPHPVHTETEHPVLLEIIRAGLKSIAHAATEQHEIFLQGKGFKAKKGGLDQSLSTAKATFT